MLDRVKKLLEPEVSLNAKLIGVSIYFGKMFESITDRLVSLEARQLEKGEKGDKGDTPSEGEMMKLMSDLQSKLSKEEQKDIAELMEKNWTKW